MPKQIDPYCMDCAYLDLHSNMGLFGCAYILRTGHSRGCPAGEGFTVKSTERKKNTQSRQIKPDTHRRDA